MDNLLRMDRFCTIYPAQKKPLNLEETRNLALEFNKSLKVSALQKVEAEAQKKEAFTNYLPRIDASGSASLMPTLENIGIPGFQLPTGPEAGAGASNAYFPGMTLETEKLSILEAGVTAQQAIYAGGQVRLGNKMASTGVEISEQAYQLKEAEVILNTDQAYWQLAAMNETVKLAEKYVQMLDSLEDQLKDMYELSLVPKSEKLRVTVQKNDAELKLLKARNGYRIMQMNLCRIIGLPLSTDIEITEKVNQNPILPDMSNSTEKALAGRQELKILDGQAQLSDYQKKMVNAAFLPQLGAQVAYQYSQYGDLYDDGLVTLGASLSIPIFHWGEKKHKKSAAQARIEQAQLNLSDSQELVQLEVQQVMIQLQEGYESILWAQKNKQEAQESLEETQASYEVGLNTTTDLLNAQASWQDAYSQEIKALANFQVLKTRYQKALGLL
ncbi:TolC family protein [Saccharicrinis fermentans]|uniref:Outer membrane channel protein n=1 Tax=Saccharicrinis fermentans DSM 9555 = JCM 21142 TaxID=869213 RepID=W7YFR7_9BACT|nr:TolC family protein [Saccharicrinis fermentans]GAF01444.1 outer membrane channel protein [Saccharicrinis fermentans DSM 9555 = JCM 21142]